MIMIGDCRQMLPTIEPESIDCIVTSPPYYNLRDYGMPGQIGAENTVEEYIDNLTDVFSKSRTVLKPNGTLWLNVADTYAQKTSLASRGNWHLLSAMMGGYFDRTSSGANRTPCQKASWIDAPKHTNICSCSPNPRNTTFLLTVSRKKRSINRVIRQRSKNPADMGVRNTL